MKPENLLTIAALGLLGLLCLKFPIWGVIVLERKFDTYPLVDRDTVAMLDKMSATLDKFGEVCEAHQFVEGEYFWREECELYPEKEACGFLGDEIERLTHEMDAAVAARKALAAKADWGLLKSMYIGGQVYTHSTWLCAPAYATFATQISIGFTPTYDTPATSDAQPG